MLRKNLGEIEWLEFELLQELPIRHGVFSRKGGVSEGSVGPLNLGTLIGDSEKCIVENQRRVAKVFDGLAVTYVDQVHSNGIVEIVKSGEKVVADALITDKKGLPLAIRHADCQAAILYDPIHEAFGVVHSGWRGNVLNIYKGVIERMQGRYHSNPKDLLVAISPSLGPSASEFIHYKKEFPTSFWDFQVKPNYFDLWAIARDQLIKAHILPHHIQIAKICTFSNPEDFFSHRRDKKRGSNATIATLL